MSRYQKYCLKNERYVAVEANREYDILLSNQWGSNEGKNGSFDRFLEMVEQYYTDFAIITLNDYLSDQIL